MSIRTNYEYLTCIKLPARLMLETEVQTQTEALKRLPCRMSREKLSIVYSSVNFTAHRVNIGYMYIAPKIHVHLFEIVHLTAIVV